MLASCLPVLYTLQASTITSKQTVILASQIKKLQIEGFRPEW